LFDFTTHAVKVTGIDVDAANHDKEAKREFWRKAGHKFFEELDLLPDAMQLWNYVNNHRVFICSATGNTVNAGPEKRIAVRRHFGEEAADKAILVKHSQDKANYASPTSILIDDRTRSIDPWIAAGGIGILHKSAADTIAQLQKLGIN
jgi:hypothetical protein